MTNSWLLFAFFAPLLWAFGNVMDGVLRKKFVPNDTALMLMWGWSRIPFILVLLPFVNFHSLPLISLLYLLFGGLIWTLAAITYYQALESEEPTRVALLLQFTPVFTLILAYFALSETLSLSQGIAFVLILFGGILASTKTVRQKFHISTSLWLIALSCFVWAGSDIIFKKFEPSFSGFTTAIFFYTLGTTIPSFISLLKERGRRITKKYYGNLSARAWWYIIGAQGSGALGSFSFAYALTLHKASLVTVLMGLQPLFAFIYGLIFAKISSDFESEDTSTRNLILKTASFVIILLGLVYLQR